MSDTAFTFADGVLSIAAASPADGYHLGCLERDVRQTGHQATLTVADGGVVLRVRLEKTPMPAIVREAIVKHLTETETTTTNERLKAAADGIKERQRRLAEAMMPANTLEDGRQPEQVFTLNT